MSYSSLYFPISSFIIVITTVNQLFAFIIIVHSCFQIDFLNFCEKVTRVGDSDAVLFTVIRIM